MKERLFYFKIKNAKLGELELRKAEIAVKAEYAAEAVDKLIHAGIYTLGECLMYEARKKNVDANDDIPLLEKN